MGKIHSKVLQDTLINLPKISLRLKNGHFSRMKEHFEHRLTNYEAVSSVVNMDMCSNTQSFSCSKILVGVKMYI